VAVASSGPYANLPFAPVPHHSVFYRPDKLQGDHSPGKHGKPGKVKEFQNGHGKVREM